MTTRSASSLYRQRPAGFADADVDGASAMSAERLESANPPERIFRLFVSSPAYAEAERRHIHEALVPINAAFAGKMRLEASGPGAIGALSQDAAENPGLSAADCDAVIAILRPRLPTDTPVSAEQAAAESGGGAGNVLSAMGARKPGTDLPDISIYRYATASDRVAGDADWESGKRAFEGWFKARGGKFLIFEDFTAPDEFGAKLRNHLDAWLERQGFTAPEDRESADDTRQELAAEIAEFETADDGLPATTDFAEEPTPAEIQEPVLAESEVASIAADAAEIAAREIVEPEPVAAAPEAEAAIDAQVANEAAEDGLGADAAQQPDESQAEAAGPEAASDEIQVTAAFDIPAPVHDTASPEVDVLDIAPADLPVPEAPPKPRAGGSARTRAVARRAGRGRARALDIEDIIGSGAPAREVEAKPADIPAPQAELFEKPADDQPTTPAAEDDRTQTEAFEQADLSSPASAPEPELFETAADSAPQVAAPAVEVPVDAPKPDEYAEVSRAPAERVAPIMLPGVAPRVRQRQRRQIPRAAFAGVAVVALVAVGLQWRSAVQRSNRAEEALSGAAVTASNLVFDLTQESRRLGGATSPASKDILNHAQQLQGLLVAAHAFDSSERKSQADAAEAAADALLKQDKLADALKSAIQAQQIFQTLTAAEPDRLDWVRMLATSNMKIGDILVAQNDLVEALGAYRDAMADGKTVTTRNPDSVADRRALTGAQQKVGDVLVVKGRLDEGLSVYRDALATRKALAQSEPGNADFERDLLEMENKIGDVLSAQNHFDDALAIYRDGLAIGNQMALKNPADSRWRGTLTLTDNKIGDVLTAKGLIDDALATYREGLAVMKALAAAEPAKTEWQSLVATSYERIGDAFVAERHYESGLSAYHDALEVVKALATKDPASVGWQRGLSETQLRIGSVLFSQGNIDGAIAAHKESLAIVKGLAAKEPDNPRWQRDVMMDNNDIGLLYVSRGARDDALPFYRDALIVAREMGAKDPKNTDWLSNRAMIDSNIGALLMEQGKRDDALTMYRDGLATAKSLVQQDPRSGDWQSGLVVALYNLAEAGEDSEANLSLALDIIKRLDTAGALRPDKKPLIGKIEEGLAKLKSDTLTPAPGKASARRSRSG